MSPTAYPPPFSPTKFTDSRFNGKKLFAKFTKKVDRVDEDTKIKTGDLKKGAFKQKFKQLVE